MSTGGARPRRMSELNIPDKTKPIPEGTSLFIFSKENRYRHVFFVANSLKFFPSCKSCSLLFKKKPIDLGKKKLLCSIRFYTCHFQAFLFFLVHHIIKFQNTWVIYILLKNHSFFYSHRTHVVSNIS